MKNRDPISSDEIRSIVESVVAPMISTFQNDTGNLIDKLTDKYVAESDEAKLPVINVNIDSPVDQSQTTHEVLPPPPPPAVCNYEPPPPPPPPPPRQPMRKTITTSRDENGNLQAIVTETGDKISTSRDDDGNLSAMVNPT